MMKESKAKSGKATAQDQKIMKQVLPFLVMSGLVDGKKKKSSLEKLTLSLRHKTVTLPNAKVTSLEGVKGGIRYLLTKDGQPMAALTANAHKTGNKKNWHVTRGEVVSSLFTTLQSMMDDYQIRSSKIVAIKSPFLQKSFLYLPGQDRAKCYVIGNEAPTQVTFRKALSLHNKTVSFLLKSHKAYKRALKKKLSQQNGPATSVLKSS